MRLVIGVAANDDDAVLRELRSIDVRFAAQAAAGLAPAHRWPGPPEVVHVRHPAL